MFDLSMQSALDIFCYVLVLIYGLALSADISTGGHVSRQQKYLLTLLCLLFLLVQGLGLVLLGERTVKQLYPLVIHVPLVLILILFMKKSVGVAIVSTCTAYLCCQPPRWGRIAVEALTQSTLAAELVYILLMPVMYYLLRRFFVAAAYNTMTSSTAALLLFGRAAKHQHTGGHHKIRQVQRVPHGLDVLDDVANVAAADAHRFSGDDGVLRGDAGVGHSQHQIARAGLAHVLDARRMVGVQPAAAVGQEHQYQRRFGDERLVVAQVRQRGFQRRVGDIQNRVQLLVARCGCLERCV